MDVGPDKTSVCLVRVHLNPTVCFAKNRRCESSRVTSPLVFPQSSFTGIEDSLKLAADELFNLQAGARPEATKFLIVFSDGDFIPFSLVGIRK